MKVHFGLDPFCEKHRTEAGHPECPARLKAVERGANGSGAELLPLQVRSATIEELTLCHLPEYVSESLQAIDEGADTLNNGEVSVSEDSGEAAIRAAGMALSAVDAVCTLPHKRAFCAVRPPGHHATPDRAMGFCIFNSVAIAARYAQRKFGVGRILIADWDVHHGNGTQDIFYEDDSVFFFSTHQSPWYPGTGFSHEAGSGAGRGFTMNRPFPAGAGSREIIGAFENDLLPAMEKFQPELVLISAGFDSRLGDPLGMFRLHDEDFSHLTRLLIDLAERYGQGRIVSVLEGGYSLEGLQAGAEAHIKTLAA